MIGVTVFRGGVEALGALGVMGVIGVIGSLGIKNYSLLSTHYSLFLVRSREMWCITKE